MGAGGFTFNAGKTAGVNMDSSKIKMVFLIDFMVFCVDDCSLFKLHMKLITKSNSRFIVQRIQLAIS